MDTIGKGVDGLLLLVHLALLLLQLLAFVDCLRRPAAAFPLAGKLTKPAWAAITGVALVVSAATGLFSFLRLPALVASIVYLVDVRPAVKEVQGGGSRW